MNIASLSNSPLYFASTQAGGQVETGRSSRTEGKLSFGDMLNQKIEEANSLQKQADQLTDSFLQGEPVEIHEMLIAMEKADLALREMTEIRNKLVEAYQNVERMQI
ncbi:MAG: flagellar hook-basal body complex protein FliE [Syntrophomonadaceae bacterium]|nr:flagellar hook-basal body complex protein FliE [Syntrophomonadaceae bacterium]